MMNLPKELKLRLITQVTLENVKGIAVHSTLNGLFNSVTHHELYEVPGEDGKCPRLFYAKKGKQWTVHALSWELDQYLRMVPSKSTSKEVPVSETNEVDEDKNEKVKELSEEVKAEESPKINEVEEVKELDETEDSEEVPNEEKEVNLTD